jgi:undecaprenyl phosphate N,N'-diacetylbacillosamine 1-phosphate transferase
MYKRYIKRLLDILLSGLLLICLSPLLAVAVILIRFRLGSSVLFIQQRIGKDEKPFRMLKFRSMSNAKDAFGALLPDIKRLTKFGRFLRASSIDELPALWNVFIGQMSLIGPRPLPMLYLPYFTNEERIRHTVRGGLTGLAQINGRNALSWDQRFAYDIEYTRQITFFGDVKILSRTLMKVVRRSDVGIRGVTGPGDLNACREMNV